MFSYYKSPYLLLTIQKIWNKKRVKNILIDYTKIKTYMRKLFKTWNDLHILLGPPWTLWHWLRKPPHPKKCWRAGQSGDKPKGIAVTPESGFSSGSQEAAFQIPRIHPCLWWRVMQGDRLLQRGIILQEKWPNSYGIDQAAWVSL